MAPTLRPAMVLAVAVVLVTAGCGIPGNGVGKGNDDATGTVPSGGFPGTLTERWVSETSSDVAGNHHAVAAGRVNGEPVVYVPIGGRSDHEGCALVAVDGSGEQRWRHAVPPRNCTVHAVADPTLADFDGDGTREVLATTTERAVFAFHPLTGEREYRQNLTAYGYTHPVLADVTGDEAPELVVSDVDGTLFVLRQNGTTVWRRALDAFAWTHPAVADFDGDGAPEVIAALGNGSVVGFTATGDVAWNRHGLGSVTWMATRHEHGAGHADGSVPDVVVATSDGNVTALDGATGATRWSRSFGAFAAVRAFGDADGDGHAEVYAVARDGKLRALDARDGSVEWTTTLTTGDVQMTPPPVAGDLDGDGTPELVAVTNHGRVLVVDPTDGAVLATYRRDALVYTHATLADTDGNGIPEIYVMYGDGRVVALTYESSSSERTP